MHLNEDSSISVILSESVETGAVVFDETTVGITTHPLRNVI